VGIDWFYRGEFANRVAAWMEKNGGLLTREDFANYAVKQRTPLQTTYRDYTIVGFPPPSSGGVHVAQILNILEHFDLAELHRREPIVATHVVVEATKLAFADRAHWLGDADFVSVPRGLASKQYAATLAERIQLDKVIEVPKHSTPDGWEQDLFGGHTAHIAAADDLGNWVAITATVNTTFGSKVIVPGTGIVLNNEMDDFSAQPGVPNVFGLIGAENNSVKPRKRPLSSMSPTIVLQDGRPMLTVGASGGPRIITQVLLAIIRHLDYQMPLDQALAEPRFHHQWVPNEIWCEEAYPVALRVQLEQLGHKLKADDKKGATQAIVWLPERGFLGVHDPRVPGKAAGY
jgi:gamma-glutamyltranspeptidase/glutathione hydrolase